jgi:hypothetical protein
MPLRWRLLQGSGRGHWSEGLWHKIAYKPGRDHTNTDVLSRFPLPDTPPTFNSRRDHTVDGCITGISGHCKSDSYFEWARSTSIQWDLTLWDKKCPRGVRLYATHSLPEMLVTDNGSVFTTSELRKQLVLATLNVHPTTWLPINTTSFQLFGWKSSIEYRCSRRAWREARDSMNTCVQHFLFCYRLTPHITAGIAPAQLLQGRLPDLLKSNVATRVHNKQNTQKLPHDFWAKARSFKIRDSVFVRNLQLVPSEYQGRSWSLDGPVSYFIELMDDRKSSSLYHRCLVTIRPLGWWLMDIPATSSAVQWFWRHSTWVSHTPDQFL